MSTSFTGNPQSAVEVLLTYGGDYQLTPSGDLAVVQDTALYPFATIQRITFLILTNPRLPNLTGNAVGVPDDDFYPDYGSGARAFVGRPNPSSNVVVDALKRNIMNALANDPFVSQNPQPAIIFSSGDGYVSTIFCTVSFTTISGQNATITDIPVGGGAA